MPLVSIGKSSKVAKNEEMQELLLKDGFNKKQKIMEFLKPRPKSQMNGKYKGVGRNTGGFTFSKHSDRASLSSYHKI